MTPDEARALLDRLEALEREARWSQQTWSGVRISNPAVAELCNMLLAETLTLVHLARRGLLAEELAETLDCMPHRPGCQHFRLPDIVCDCGLEAALAKWEASK